MNRPSRYSQCGRIIRVLEDGEWHSASEIFRNLPQGATIHSRVSELRREWGCKIEHETRGVGAKGSFYKLVVAPWAGTVEPSPAQGGAPASSSSSLPVGASPQKATAPLPQAGPEPLTLFGDERTHYAKESEAA